MKFIRMRDRGAKFVVYNVLIRFAVDLLRTCCTTTFTTNRQQIERVELELEGSEWPNVTEQSR